MEVEPAIEELHETVRSHVRAREQTKRTSMTDEKRAAQRIYNQTYASRRDASMTETQRAAQRASNRERARKRKEQMTDEQRQAQRAYNRSRQRSRRANMTEAQQAQQREIWRTAAQKRRKQLPQQNEQIQNQNVEVQSSTVPPAETTAPASISDNEPGRSNMTCDLSVSGLPRNDDCGYPRSHSQHEPHTEDWSTIKRSNLTWATNRRREKPPVYTSTQQRREATNTRRRERRKIQQSSNACTSGPNPDSNTLSIQQPENNDASIPTQPSQTEHIHTSNPHPEDGHIVTNCRQKRPMYASTQERSETTNTPRGKLRTIQQVNDESTSGPNSNTLSIQQPENNDVSTSTQPSQTEHTHTSTPHTDDGRIITNRQQRRPPMYASTQERSDTTNTRRRKLRTIQQVNDASTSGPNSNTLSIQQPENTDVSISTQPSQTEHIHASTPHTNDGRFIRNRQQRKPHMYASTQERSDTTNTRRTKLRTIQQVNDASTSGPNSNTLFIQQPENTDVLISTQPSQTEHIHTSTPHTDVGRIITNREQRRPPMYASTQERSDKTNTRRRKLRTIQQVNDASMSGELQ